MLAEIFLTITFGIIAGIIAGLLPGIHPNLIAVLALSASPLLLNYFSPLSLSLFIVSMAITNAFISTIPSIFLGAPDPSTAVSILPGHKLLLEGRGFEAVVLITVGSLCSLILALALTPILILFSQSLYEAINPYISYILIISCIILILKERKSRLFALITFLLSGALGIATLNLPVKEPLFPLFSGLFGISSLLLSLKSETDIPPQSITTPDIKFGKGLAAIFLSVIAGCICSFLPGIGPSQAATLSSSLTKKLKGKYFMMIVGGLNTVNIVISFIALYTINKSRSGAVVAVSKLLDSFGLKELLLFLATTLLVAGISTILTLKLSKISSSLVEKINYTTLCLTTMIFITGLVIILSSWLGLLILITSTALGILPQLTGTNRNHLMGCLLLPVILFFTL